MGKSLYRGLFLYCKISFLITLFSVTLVIYYVWNGSNGSQPTRDSTHFLCTYCLSVLWIQVPPTKRIIRKGSVEKISVCQSITDPFLIYISWSFFSMYQFSFANLANDVRIRLSWRIWIQNTVLSELSIFTWQ